MALVRDVPPRTLARILSIELLPSPFLGCSEKVNFGEKHQCFAQSNWHFGAKSWSLQIEAVIRLKAANARLTQFYHGENLLFLSPTNSRWERRLSSHSLKTFWRLLLDRLLASGSRSVNCRRFMVACLHYEFAVCLAVLRTQLIKLCSVVRSSTTVDGETSKAWEHIFSQSLSHSLSNSSYGFGCVDQVYYNAI